MNIAIPGVSSIKTIKLFYKIRLEDFINYKN